MNSKLNNQYQIRNLFQDSFLMNFKRQFISIRHKVTRARQKRYLDLNKMTYLRPLIE